MNLENFTGFEPLWRVQFWAATHLLFMQDSSGDLRYDVVALVMRAISAFEAFAEKQLSAWALHTMDRARQGADFAAAITAADTMVAAADR